MEIFRPFWRGRKGAISRMWGRGRSTEPAEQAGAQQTAGAAAGPHEDKTELATDHAVGVGNAETDGKGSG